jgi:hypothetical protein
MINNVAFDRGMAVLMASFPDYPVTPETLKVYQTALNDVGFTDVQFERVIWNHIKTKKWFPKISELIEANKPSTLEIWNRLILAAEAGEKPDLDPAVKSALGLLGGWEQFSRTPYTELHRRYKDFKEALESAAAPHGQGVKQLEQGI